jgi:hypothetical protein
VAARLGDQKAQAFLKKEEIAWTPEDVPNTTSSDKSPRPQKPETKAEPSLSVTSPYKIQQRPSQNAGLSMDEYDPYKKIKGIVLQNGKVIEGKIVRWDPDIVKIQTKDGKVSSYDFKKEVQTFITE